MRRPNIDALAGFMFTVEMQKVGTGCGDKPEIVAWFQGVEGLSYEVEMIEYRDSAQPNLPLFRQGRRKAGHITLKRGLGVENGSDNLVNWISECEKGVITPRNITITVGRVNAPEGREEDGAKSYELINCRPTKWTVGGLDSNTSAIAIESIELVVEETRRK